jgi:hypothetical protein
MSFKIAVQKKAYVPQTTLDLFKDEEITRHEAAIAGISELPVGKICNVLKSHPFWMIQSLYCKMIKLMYVKGSVAKSS